MKKKNDRFNRLEFGGLLGSIFFRKWPSGINRFKRFEKLEVDGHQVKIEIPDTEQAALTSKRLLCPKCKEPNQQENERCFSCGYIFEQLEKNASIKNYERNCPNCGRRGNRQQENCYHCGKLFPTQRQEEIIAEQKNLAAADLQQGEPITVTVDGKVYQSSESNLPPDISDLMLNIKRNGYSKELVDAWIRKRNSASLNSELLESINSNRRINSLRLRVSLQTLALFGTVVVCIVVGILLLTAWFNLFKG